MVLKADNQIGSNSLREKAARIKLQQEQYQFLRQGKSGVLKKRTDDTMTTTRLRELVTEWVTGDYSSQ